MANTSATYICLFMFYCFFILILHCSREDWLFLQEALNACSSIKDVLNGRDEVKWQIKV